MLGVAGACTGRPRTQTVQAGHRRCRDVCVL